MRGVIRHPGVPEAHVPQNDGSSLDRRLNRRMADSIAFKIVWFDDAFDIPAVCSVQMGCWPELCCAIGCAYVDNGNVYDDRGCLCKRTACNGMRHIGMDGLCVVAGESCISGVEAVLDGAAQNLLSDFNDDVVEQHIFKEVWLKGRRRLLDIAFVEIEWRVVTCEDFFDICQHRISQDIDVRRVDGIFDDYVSIGVKVNYSLLNVHKGSLPMRAQHCVLTTFYIVMRGCEFMN